MVPCSSPLHQELVGSIPVLLRHMLGLLLVHEFPAEFDYEYEHKSHLIQEEIALGVVDRMFQRMVMILCNYTYDLV